MACRESAWRRKKKLRCVKINHDQRLPQYYMANSVLNLLREILFHIAGYLQMKTFMVSF